MILFPSTGFRSASGDGAFSKRVLFAIKDPRLDSRVCWRVDSHLNALACSHRGVRNWSPSELARLLNPFRITSQPFDYSQPEVATPSTLPGEVASRANPAARPNARYEPLPPEPLECKILRAIVPPERSRRVGDKHRPKPASMTRAIFPRPSNRRPTRTCFRKRSQRQGVRTLSQHISRLR